MKHKSHLIVFIIILLFTSTTFAYVNNSSVNQKIIYCPEKITCSSSGKNVICNVIGDNLEYWGGIRSWTNLEHMVVGEYIFSNASAPYQAQEMRNADCSYKYQQGSNPFPVRDFHLSNDFYGGNLEALYDKSGRCCRFK